MIDKATIEQWMRDANPIPTLDDVDADEFARFVAAAHTRRAAVMQAPTQHPTPVTPVTPPPQRRRKAWAFAAAFILIIAAIGIAALVARSRGDAPVADEPTAPVTVPPTTSAPDPIDVQSLTWTRVPHDEAVFNPTGDDQMWDVTVGGPGLVAVGNTSAGAGVWVSEDGITWSLVTSDEPTGIDGPDPTEVGPLRTEGEMYSVTVGGPGLVAVGSAWTVEGPVSGAAVWTSEDGISWSRAIVDSESGGMYYVTAGGPGLVAIGDVIVEDWSVEEEGPVEFAWPRMWTSVDGSTWTRVPQDLGSGWVNGVTDGGPGLVAVGSADNFDSAAVWTSPDGLTWTRVPHDETVLGGNSMNDVVAGGPGLVAVGGNVVNAAAWTSPDGLTWTQVPPAQFTGSFYGLHSVISVGTQLVAVGGADKDDSPGVWTSPDGLTWTQAKISGPGEINAVAATDTGLIAVGQDGGSAAVWIATED